MKNILIINGEPFQDQTATGITLKSIFNLYPKSNLYFIHLSKLQPDLYYSSNVFSFFKDDIEIEKFNSDISFVPMTNSIFPSLKNELRQWADLYPMQFSSRITNFIVESKCDFIYSTLGNIRIIKLVLYAQKLLNCNIIPHFMDDWKESIYDSKRFLIHNFFLRRGLKNIFKKSKHGLAISEKMAVEYQNQYNIQFLTIMNCVPDSQILIPTVKLENELILVYTGGLHLNRWKSLLIFSKAMQLIINEYDFKLEIYCSTKDRLEYEKLFEKFTFVYFMGYVPVYDIEKVLFRSDFLIHCESFDSKFIKYTRLSLSTKIPTYLKQGKPIIAIGPNEIESIDYLSRHNAAIIFDNNDINMIAYQIKDLFDGNINVEKIVDNGVKLVSRNHTFSSVSLKLSTVFDS